MNGRSIFAAALALAGAAGAAAAQDGAVRSECQQGGIKQYANDLCQKAVDIFTLVAPQFGTSIAGGNAVLGTGGHLGGLGHFSVGVRLNAIKGTIPDFEEGFTVAAGNASNTQPIPTRNQALVFTLRALSQIESRLAPPLEKLEKPTSGRSRRR